MSKTVILSIDDARWDTYVNAYPILKKYRLTATINVISDFIFNPDNYVDQICKSGAMTIDELKECQDYGIELACHGKTHKNNVKDILDGISEMRDMGLNVDHIGFASPTSYLTWENSKREYSLIKSGKLSYIRTGCQVKREGIRYSVLAYMERKFHSKRLFAMLNKRFVNNYGNIDKRFFYSVSVTKYTTVKQIKYLLNKLKDGEILILCLHSILKRKDKEYGQGIWYWDVGRFEQLCQILNNMDGIDVRDTKSLVM